MIREFVLPPAALDELAHGGAWPGAPAAMERGKNTLLLHAVATRSRELGHPGAQAAADGYRLLTHVHRAAPAAAAQTLGYPLLGTWASATVAALERGADDAAPHRLAAVAAAAVLLARLPLTVRFHTDAGAAELPGLGRLVLPGIAAGEPVALVADGSGAARLDVAGERFPLPRVLRADAEAGGAHGERARWEGVRDAGFLLDDVDPWRFPGPIPPLERLAGPEAAAWGTRLRRAMRLLNARHPGVARALREVTKVVVPISPPEAGTRSATARTAYGSVAMSRPHDTRSAALTLAHEVQHAKLTMLMDLFDLVRPGVRDHYYAPWRDDPRPAAALLQGAYAHMGVAGFWRVERHVAADPEVAHSEFARWRDAAYEVCLTLLAGGALTPLGRRFVRGMLETLAAWRAERVPAEASARARRAAARHRLQWVARHRS
ncbi:HEXXH motif-containing putative peptide modification protein [Nonomuraea sp. N2-4H]|uniref:aKG-HExxH-type peptide beta-hydroxylase n=1 Tax=Nonomuraea sp. N2-4H TaxID=3128898 RepID=UPI003252728C